MLQISNPPIDAQTVLALGAPPRRQAPASADELATILAEARAHQQAVVPWGGGTEQGLGAPPTRADRIVETGGLCGIIAYAPEDLTLSVRAGTTLAEIRDALAEHRQFLPLDLPNPEVATIGGVVATAAIPVRRLRYGAARDLVIGLEAALPDGALYRSGGRVVKNVAGYDLCKLFTGALGTLGVITVANLKVQPLPAAQAHLRARFGSAAGALGAAAALAATSLGYGALLVSRQGPDARWLLDVLAEGFAGTVAHQLRTALATIAETGGDVEARTEDVAAVNQEIARLAAWRGVDALSTVLLRGSVTPARLGAALEAVDLGLGTPGAALQADAGTGTWFARAPLATATPETLAGAIHRVRAAVAAHGGNLVLAGGPAALRAACDPWGAPAAAEGLARAIKHTCDPGGVMNPGRFAYGI